MNIAQKAVTTIIVVLAVVVFGSMANSATSDQLKSAYVQDLKAVYDFCLAQSEENEIILKVVSAVLKEHGAVLNRTEASILIYHMCVGKTYMEVSDDIVERFTGKGEKI